MVSFARHQLVADTFFPVNQDDIDNNRTYIDHIDENKINNNVRNLRRVTAKFFRIANMPARARHVSGGWQAKFGRNRLGIFTTKQEALEVARNHKRAILAALEAEGHVRNFF